MTAAMLIDNPGAGRPDAHHPHSSPTGVAMAVLGEPRLLAGVRADAALDLAQHLTSHGPMTLVGLGWLIDTTSHAQLRGRGGAGFPVAAKLEALRAAPAGLSAVVVNGSEGEPASWKDRVLLARSPHLVLDGALLVASALATTTVVVAVADPGIADVLRRACAQRADAAGIRVEVRDGGFIGGEARALLRALDAGPHVPPGRRVLPTVRGLAGAPTFLSNAETFAQLAVLARAGSRFTATTLLTVSGGVRAMTVAEAPMGIALGDVGGAVGLTSAPQAVIVGGYHGTWLPFDPALPVSWAGLQAAGGTLGAGVLCFVGADTCGLGELARVAGWLAAQSAKQCGPCQFGLPALAAAVTALAAGDAAGADAAAALGPMISGRGACAHPDGAVRFIASGLALLRADVELHRRHGSCGRPVLGQLPLPGQSGRPAQSVRASGRGGS